MTVRSRRRTSAHGRSATVGIRPQTVIRGVDVWPIEDTAVIEWLLTRPERNIER